MYLDWSSEVAASDVYLSWGCFSHTEEEEESKKMKKKRVRKEREIRKEEEKKKRWIHLIFEEVEIPSPVRDVFLPSKMFLTMLNRQNI